MDFQSQAEAMSDQSQQARVAQAAIKVAVDVMAEDGSTAGHAERAALALAVLRTPEPYGATMLRGVVTNANAGTGTDDPLDEDSALEFVIASLWDAYAGYSPTA